MNDRPPQTTFPVADIAALAALAWVAAAALHEGLGHGVACMTMGGVPTRWSTFHFGCDQQALALWGRRIIAGAGTMVNLALMAIGWLWWRKSRDMRGRLSGWIVFAINGLTSFGYLVFSAAFGIGDWNGAGVMIGVGSPMVSRGLPAIVGLIGYYCVVRAAGRMMSRTLRGPDVVKATRRLTFLIWVTTGVISLLAAAMAGSDWRTTLVASVGVALGGNAGLLSVARFVTPSTGTDASSFEGSVPLIAAAAAVVAAFVTILGPGIALR